MNIHNSNQRRFDTVMRREHKNVCDYYDSNMTYEVFFRTNGKGNNPQGKIRIYFTQNTNIQIGTVIVVKGSPYLIISRDADESDVYYTSIARRCEMTLTVKYGDQYVGIPFVVDKERYVTMGNQSISVVDGAVTVYTGLNEYVQAMKINEVYYSFGGRYEVSNYFYNNGLAYIYMERVLDKADTYELIYNGTTILDIASETYQLYYTALKNGAIEQNPTLQYTSNNETIATVDEKGLVTMKGKGNVTINATWTDGNNTSCPTDIVIDGDESPSIIGTVSITGYDTVKIGRNRVYTANFFDNSGNAVADVVPIWTISNCTFEDLITRTEMDNKITLLIEDEEVIGEIFTLCVVDVEGKYQEGQLEIQVIEGF